MPTYHVEERFWNDFDRLSAQQQQQFLRARAQLVATLRSWEATGCQGRPQYPARLGVKKMQGYREIMEFAWAPDGRCTWQFGTQQQPGTCHVIWRRIGSHEIYADP